MSEPKGYKIDEEQAAALQAQHELVQKSIEALDPEKQKTVKALQKLVDYELEQNNQVFFSDEMFKVDAFLAKNRIPGNYRESLMAVIEKTSKGEVFIFVNKSFIKTYNNLIFTTQDYIKSLEMTIAEQVQYKHVIYKQVKITKTKRKSRESQKEKSK